MKSKTTAAILAFFLGGLGGHKFYLGQAGQGILYILFCWTFIPAFIACIEFIILICQSQAEFDQKYNRAYIPPVVLSEDILGDISKLADLHEKGFLTKEVFEEKKRLLLNKIN